MSDSNSVSRPPEANYPATTQVAYAESPQVPRGFGLALASLIVGVFAFFVGWVPVLGLLLGGTAVTLGVIALAKRQSKGLGITGIALGILAALTSLIVTLVLIIGGTSTTSSGSPVADPEPSQAVDEPSEEVVEPVEEEPVPDQESAVGSRENPVKSLEVV